MKTFEIAPEEVHDRIADLIERYHPKLKAAGVTIHALFATSSSGHPVSAGGYPALACVRITSLKDRVKGNRDAEIVIDAERYEEMSGAEQDGLLDHELYHLEPQMEDDGETPKRDKAGRPKIAMRKHDVQIGWFTEIAQRHGPASPERIQARALFDKHGQAFFPFLTA